MNENYQFLKKNGFLEYDKNHHLEDFKKENSNSIFLSKTLLNIKDFDCLVDDITYKLFKQYKRIDLNINLLPKKKYLIKCAFYEKMFIIIFHNDRRIKLFSKFIKEPNDELIQLTFDCDINNIKDATYDIIKDLFLLSFMKKDIYADYHLIFINNYLSDKDSREKLLKN